MVGRYKIDPHRAILKIKDWPELDRSLWINSLTRDDPFSDNGQRANNRKISNDKVAHGIGRWLTFIKINLPELLALHPADRITKNTTLAYIKNMRDLDNKDQTLISRLQELHSAAIIFDSNRSYNFIKEISSKIRQNAKPAKDKDSRYITSDALLNLGLKLINDVQNQTTPRLKAIAYRNGLCISFLALRPLRRKNLTEITLGKNLLKKGNQWILSFSREETKTGNRYDSLWPDVLINHLEEYLKVHRPVLMAIKGRWMAPVGDRLWVSSNGSPQTQVSIFQEITKNTKKEFGRSINPHLFRDAAATTIAIENPEHILTIANILGHRSIKSTEKYYERSNQIQSHAWYMEHIHKLRKSRPK
jgi:integrase